MNHERLAQFAGRSLQDLIVGKEWFKRDASPTGE
jgi:hypothetical protein